MTAIHPSASVWGAVYSAGQFMTYPYEVAVRLVKRHLRTDGFQGTVLDHGCGSGNHLELFVRNGVRVHGTEIAEQARGLIAARFMGANLAQPPITIIDLQKSLGPQLPAYDHVFTWGAIHYNTKEGTRRDIATLIEKCPAGGCFILCVPSRNDVVARESEELPDGSRRIISDVSGQTGALVTVPDSDEELSSWCAGIAIRDLGRFGWTIAGRQSEFLYVYGTKA